MGQCQAANSLYNCGLYEFKQRHYKQLEKDGGYSTYWKGDEYRHSWKLRRITATSKYEIDKVLQALEPYKLLAAQSAQQVLDLLQQDINSFNSLVGKFFKGEVGRPRIPKYRKSGGLMAVTIKGQSLRFKDGFAYPSVSKLSKPDVMGDIKLEVPLFVDTNLVRQVRVRPSRGDFWVDWICDDGFDSGKCKKMLIPNKVMAIDHGVKFWLSAVTSTGKSFILEAPQLKTATWKYQKKVKQYKEGKVDFYWDEHLDKITGKYNRQIRDAVNKACRFLINRCLKERIGTIVIGWNKDNKQNIDMGRKNNYEVVMMPTARLIKRLGELCDEYGIKLIVTSEEYTSKASFKHLADLPKYGEKPRDWNPRGKRISRDMYRNDDGSEVHADINAAGNILRKVADLVFTSRLFLNQAYSMIKKGALTDPKRYSLYGNLKRKYRSAALAHAGTSA